MKSKYQIGSLILKNPCFLAPMHNVNDIAFRILCKKAGASLCYTELTNPQTKKPINLIDKPAVQFACNNSRGIKKFIKKHNKNISLYNFNLGCPSPHAKQSKVGYFMINDFKAIEQILQTIKQSTNKPLTIKIRKMPEPQTKEIIKIANKYCDAIAVHPRTQSQGYSGIPDIEYAEQIKRLTNLPIVYSGNINNKQQAEQMLKEFDFIMIGRKAIGNPNIFQELTNKNQKSKSRKKITFKDYLRLAKKHNLNFKQIKFQAMNFTKSCENSAKLRAKLSIAKSLKEILTILKK